MKKTSQRILVTGGAGLIGSHLCKRLLQEGNEVICADNLYSGSRRNITPLMEYSRFEFLRHDITFPLYVEVDLIFNLACPASPVHYQRDPVQTVKTNVHGAINMLGLAKRLRVPIVQASTSEVYGDPDMHPQRESYRGSVNPVGPRSCYDEGKRCAETLFSDYRKQHGLDTKIARIFNTYGPNMQLDDGRVISNFIVRALHNEPLEVSGDGSQTRSFCFVDDISEALISLSHAGGNVSGPMNLGNPCEISIDSLARTIIDLTGSFSRIRNVPLPEDDPSRRCPDISMAKKELGWEPKIPLTEGLKRTIEYFKKELEPALDQDKARLT